MQGVGFSLQEIKRLLDLRERPRNACREVSELLKTKLAKVRGTIRDLEKLERELAVDLKKCNRELAYSKKHTPRNCPILQISTEAMERLDSYRGPLCTRLPQPSIGDK